MIISQNVITGEVTTLEETEGNSPTPEEIRAAARAEAVIDRGPLCMALYTAGILSGPSAIAASKGEWPPEFNSFLGGLPSAEQVYAQITWANATSVRYANPLLKDAALAFCQGDAAAATALLDQLFGVA
ncbi:MAG: hypothetical protein ACK5PF_01895 [bacterium]